VLSTKPQNILLVDDEPMVLSLLATVLDRAGYRVTSAVDAMDALELAARPDGAPDLLLTDVTMPGLNGPLLARAILHRSPCTRILFMTGHPAVGEGESGIPRGADVLRKPFRVGELVERVRLALEAEAETAAAAAC
jgi:DNA-binding response OmpR family regulator